MSINSILVLFARSCNLIPSEEPACETYPFSWRARSTRFIFHIRRGDKGKQLCCTVLVLLTGVCCTGLSHCSAAFPVFGYHYWFERQFICPENFPGYRAIQIFERWVLPLVIVVSGGVSAWCRSIKHFSLTETHSQTKQFWSYSDLIKHFGFPISHEGKIIGEVSLPGEMLISLCFCLRHDEGKKECHPDDIDYIPSFRPWVAWDKHPRGDVEEDKVWHRGTLAME